MTSRRPYVLAFVALSALLALAGSSARQATAAASQTPPVVPGELIVGFEGGSSQAQQNAAVAQAGGTRTASFQQIRAVLVRVPPSLTAVATKLLLGLPQVRYVEPNHVVRTVETTPNDPSFNQLWGLSNTGQTGGTADADVDAPEAWDVSTGSSDVVVGVTDTGVDFSHPDLAQQQWVNAGENCGSTDPAAVCADRSDAVDDDGNGYVDDWRGWDFVSDDNNPFDDHRHGTHVAGTIGAVGDNGIGVAGVNWNVKIMALKFLNSAGSGTTADAVAATLYAADKGAHVSSNSWGGGPFDQSLLDAIEYGANRGMLFVAAAGNDGRNNDTTPFYPSSNASEAIVSVAATDHADALAFFSNYGAASVDLGAPGVNILSTTPGNAYESFSGTSMATPHVAGVAALLKARYPDASLYGLKALLLRSVDPVASLAGRTTTGGRLNAFNAVSCVDTPKVWLGAPSPNFVAGVGDSLQVTVLGSNCATPAGLGNVSVTVNGSPVALTAGSPDRGLYRGTFTVPSAGPLTVVASVTAGGSTATHTVSGSAFVNYTCQDVPFAWVDVTAGTRLSGRRSRRRLLDAQHRLPRHVLRPDLHHSLRLVERVPRARLELRRERPPQRRRPQHCRAQRLRRPVLGRPQSRCGRRRLCGRHRRRSEPDPLHRVVQRASLLALRERHRDSRARAEGERRREVPVPRHRLRELDLERGRIRYCRGRAS